jgi:hypothetical protein
VFPFAGLTALLLVVSGARGVVLGDISGQQSRLGDNVVWSEILGGIF